MQATSDVETLRQDQVEHYLSSLCVNPALQKELGPSGFLGLLHHQHTTRISFSTMSYHEGSVLEPYKADQQMNAITLQEAYEQILMLRKGGTCAALNKLFASLLKTLGYEVYAHKAQVFGEHDYKYPAAHRFSTVKIDNNIYLIDIGFSDHAPKDMLLLYRNGQLATEPQGKGLFQYKFSLDDEDGLILQYFTKNTWRNIYAFQNQTTYSEQEYAVQSEAVNQTITGFRTHFFFATRSTIRGRIQMLDSTLRYQYEGSESESIQEETVTISPQVSLSTFLTTMDEFFGLKYTGPFRSKGKEFTTEVQADAVEKLDKIKSHLM